MINNERDEMTNVSKDVKKLVEEALARRPKAVLAMTLQVAPALITRWANGTSTPSEEQVAKLEAILTEDKPAAESAPEQPKTDGALPPPADDELVVVDVQAPPADAPAVGNGLEPLQTGKTGKTIGPDADAPVKTPAPEPTAVSLPDHGEGVISGGADLTAVHAERQANAITAERQRHEANAAAVRELISTRGWCEILLPAIASKREHHARALLDAKGRDVPLHQGGYAALAWILELMKKPAEELAAARAEMPLFNDAGEPAGASA